MVTGRRVNARRPRTLRIGTVCEGTLDAAVLAKRFYDAADALSLTRQESRMLKEAYERYFSRNELDRTLTADDVCDMMRDILEQHCPPFTYFSSFESDGAAFGCWIDWDAIGDAEHDRELVRSAGGPISLHPNSPMYWLQVNDHGNATLYRRGGRRWYEIWAVV